MTSASKKSWTITLYFILAMLTIEAIAFEHSNLEPRTSNLKLDGSIQRHSFEERRLESSRQTESPESTHKAEPGSQLIHSEAGDRQPHTSNLLAVEDQIRNNDDNEKTFVSAYWLFVIFFGLLFLVIIGVGCMFCKTGSEEDDHLNELRHIKNQNKKEDSLIIMIDDDDEYRKEKEAVLKSRFFRPTHLFKANSEEKQAAELTDLSPSAIIQQKEEVAEILEAE